MSGKSCVTKQIIADARSAGKNVAVAAPTGVAAINIDGSTLHSLAKIQVPKTVKTFGSMYTTSAREWRDMDLL